jgi:hypothetical protein
MGRCWWSARVPRSNADWSRKLTRRLMLQDGTPVVTLEEAAGALDRYFSTVTQSRSLEITIEALMTAARSGKRAHIAATTDSLARALSERRVLVRNDEAAN